MADLLIERTQNTSWVVTYKALITIHHLMCYGNERFSQYMASHNSKFILSTFMDRTGVQGIDMSTYIRKYAHYLNEKRETYKLMGYDFCKVKRGLVPKKKKFFSFIKENSYNYFFQQRRWNA